MNFSLAIWCDTSSRGMFRAARSRGQSGFGEEEGIEFFT
jgi:hypothetical protein